MNTSTGNGVLQIIIGLVWFVAGIMILIYTWSWMEIIAEQILDDFYLAIYWVGIFAMIFLTIFLPPFVIIIDAFKHEDITQQ